MSDPPHIVPPFADAVKDEFKFLSTSYRFRVVTTERTFVRFESAHVFVNAYHGRSSFELGVEIGRFKDRNEREQYFHLGEVVRLQDARAWQEFRAYQTADPKLVIEGVQLLAQQLKLWGNDALCGNADIFAALRQQRIEDAAEYAHELRLSRARTKAYEAWKQHNYVDVALYYGQFEGDLSHAERGKLQYARGKLLKAEGFVQR